LFEFLEVENNEHKGQVHYQEFNRDIPDNQRLTLSDLQIINPSASTLKAISKKILNKYLCIPLFMLLPGSKPLLPKHLKKEYSGHIAGKKSEILYVAMIEPFDLQVLNIIRTITEYSVVSVPVEKEAATIFLNTVYNRITNGETSVEPEEEGFRFGDLIKFILKNSIYILFFLVVLAGLISVKLYIKA
jgi:hypothetical protein